MTQLAEDAQDFAAQTDSLEAALAQEEKRVDDLIKAAKRYNSALAKWKKASQTGDIAARQKAADQATSQIRTLVEPTDETAACWNFDTRSYFESDLWWQELQSACSAIGLKVFLEAGVILSSPVTIDQVASKGQLRMGKKSLPTVRPSFVAKQLKTLRDRNSGGAPTQFLESLYKSYLRNVKALDGGRTVPLRAIYEQFCEAPGWSAQNTRVAFAQDILRLLVTNTRFTRAGKELIVATDSTKAKSADIFAVVKDDGNKEYFYGIAFK